MSEGRPSARRAVFAATLGNALEFYDFTVFALFAIQIGQAFFPSEDRYVSLMASLATFGAGFISRPLGAWIIGGYADRHGRRPALMLSMLLMGVGILGIALTPGYDTLGIAAPVIVVLARLIQGFALGGEVGPATAYMLENAAVERRGIVISMQRASQLVANLAGALVGMVLSALMPSDQFADYGWRIALLLGAAIIPFALLIRRNLPETVHDAEAVPSATAHNTNGFTRTMALGFLIITSGTIGAYVLIYLTTFAQATLGLSSKVAMTGQFVATLAALVSTLAGGWLSDRVGRRPVFLAAYALAIVTAPLLFAWMIGTQAAGPYILSCVLLGLFASAANSPGNAAIIECLPKHVRARAFAMVYALPVTIFGGTTQMVVAWLEHRTGDAMAVVWYPVAAMTMGLAAMALLRESAPSQSQKRITPMPEAMSPS